MKLYKYVRDVDLWDVKVTIKLLELDVIRETKYCYVIKHAYNKSGLKYILKENGNKKFARESKELALNDFIYKTKKCIRYQKQNLETSNEYLNIAENLKL